MKFSPTLTLLSSSLLLASAGLQAAVIQVSESVSHVVYQGQQTITEEHPSIVQDIVETPAIVAIEPETPAAKQTENTPVILVTKPINIQSDLPRPKPEVLVAESADKPVHEVKSAPIILPLPLKISPTVNTAVAAPAKPLAALVVAKPSLTPAALPVTTLAVLPSAMPTATPVYPVLNASALVAPVPNEVEEEASLFSAISDWFSVKPVKPWQKGTLAKKAMKPGGEVPEFDVFSEKVFAYKQGSIGGNGVGGGGCGCN